MILYTGLSHNKSYIKEEGTADFNNTQKNIRFTRSSLTFNRYKHFKYNKWRFESENIALDTILESINKIVTILDKYANDLSSLGPKLKKLFIQDLIRERDEIVENRIKIGEELVLKFNVDKLCENAIKFKLNESKLNLNKYNLQVPVADLEADKFFLNKLDSRRARSDRSKLPKPRLKSEVKRGRSAKKQEQTVDSSNLNYYIKYFNYLKLFYQYYLNHFVSVYIIYKSYCKNGIKTDRKRSIIRIRDGDRNVFILGKLFIYLRKLMVLHLKCLINLMPLSFVYNPDNFINYDSLTDYHEIINSKMNSLSDIDNELKLELKRDLFDGPEMDKRFDLEEFNQFLSTNNLNKVLSDVSYASITNPPLTMGDTSFASVTCNNGSTYVSDSYSITGATTDDYFSFTSSTSICGTSPFTHCSNNPSSAPNSTTDSAATLSSNGNLRYNSNNHDSSLVAGLSTSASLFTTSASRLHGSSGADTKKSFSKLQPKMSNGLATKSATATSGISKSYNTDHVGCDKNKHGDERHGDGRYDSKYDSKYRDSKYNNKYHDKYNDGRYDRYDNRYYDDEYYDGKYDSKYHHDRNHDDSHSDSRYKDSKYDGKYREGRYCDGRYHDSTYATPRSTSRSSSSSSSSFKHSKNEDRAERHGYRGSIQRSGGTGSGSSSNYSSSKNYPMRTSEGLKMKRELQTHHHTASGGHSSSSGHNENSKKVKLDTLEKERLGKELKSGKKLKDSDKFNTMNIKEIFNIIASKNTSAAPANPVDSKHIGYKSTAQSMGTEARADANKGAHDSSNNDASESRNRTDEGSSRTGEGIGNDGLGDSTRGSGAVGIGSSNESKATGDNNERTGSVYGTSETNEGDLGGSNNSGKLND